MSLKDRKFKRIEALAGSEILVKDGKGRAILVAVPGSDSKLYQVSIGRARGIQTQCKCGGKACQGNSRHTICYHSMAAVALAAGHGKLYWCENEFSANRLNRILKGNVIPVSSLQGKGQAWIVYKAAQ